MPERRTPHRRRLAIDDFAGHSRGIAESNLDAALRFLDAIETTVELLCQFPEAGGPCQQHVRRLMGFVRSWSADSATTSFSTL
ncbi:type II toxin-antitoxin system RelE/ParE family toxin [Rosistilla oblonga]|uniref:type II toxin-antitoxin system RelE/ParE family toxin n=1 Tax=Rosistilla oblonga TaxID=2527990 RepID=UPI003A980D0C